MWGGLLITGDLDSGLWGVLLITGDLDGCYSVNNCVKIIRVIRHYDELPLSLCAGSRALALGAFAIREYLRSQLLIPTSERVDSELFREISLRFYPCPESRYS